MRAIWKVVLSLKNVMIVTLVPLLALPLPLCVPGKESLCAYVILIMALFWLTEALPLNVTALLPVFLFPLTGVISADAVAKAFFTSTTLMFIGGMAVGVAIEEWNIHKRIALKILLLLGSKPVWLLLGLMLTSWFLSMWISNSATTTMMMPIATAILDQLKENKRVTQDEDEDAVRLEVIAKEEDNEKIALDEDNNERSNENATGVVTYSDDDGGKEEEWRQLGKAFSLCIAYAANIGGTGTQTGSTPNLVLKDQADLVYEQLGRKSPLTFGLWLAFGVPTSLVILILAWIWLSALFFRCRGCLTGRGHLNEAKIKQILMDQYRKLGHFSFGQVAVICHLVAIAVLWVTRDIGGAYGWAGLFKDKFIKDSVPAIFVGCLLFIFPSKLPWKHASETYKVTQIPPLLTWRTFSDRMPWGVVFLLGGGFSMAKAAQESGLSAWIGGQLNSMSSLSPFALCLVVSLLIASVTEVASNTATAVLILPILAQISVSIGLEPLYLMFPAATAASFAFMLPVATPPNAVAFSYGYIKVLDMVKSGFIVNIVAVFVLVCSNEFFGKALFTSS